MRRKRYLLGIDIDATGCKSCIYNTRGRLVADGYAECAMPLPEPGWVGESPEGWWRALYAGAKQCLSAGIAPDETRYEVISDPLPTLPGTTAEPRGKRIN